MTSIAIYLGIVFVAAIVFVVIGFYAYNRRLDRIARGEERDTHSPIPEPSATISGATVLMILAVVTFLIINALNNKINALQLSLSRMESKQNAVQSELEELKEQIENKDKVVRNFTWKFGEPDYAVQTAEAAVFASLKEYSDDTSVAFQVNGRTVQLAAEGGGNYRGTFTGPLFERYLNPVILVTENGKTVAEAVEFPEEIYWDLFPVPGFECSFESGTKPNGKFEYGGWYRIITDEPEEIVPATITYMSNGQDLKTMDITEEAHNRTEITLEKGLDVKRDLTFRLEITTKEGYKIVEQQVMIFEASPDFEDEDYLKILDPAGNLLWEDYYQ